MVTYLLRPDVLSVAHVTVVGRVDEDSCKATTIEGEVVVVVKKIYKIKGIEALVCRVSQHSRRNPDGKTFTPIISIQNKPGDNGSYPDTKVRKPLPTSNGGVSPYVAFA